MTQHSDPAAAAGDADFDTCAHSAKPP
jgi:hypothetical protein